MCEENFLRLLLFGGDSDVNVLFLGDDAFVFALFHVTILITEGDVKESRFDKYRV